MRALFFRLRPIRRLEQKKKKKALVDVEITINKVYLVVDDRYPQDRRQRRVAESTDFTFRPRSPIWRRN